MSRSFRGNPTAEAKFAELRDSKPADPALQSNPLSSSSSKILKRSFLNADPRTSATWVKRQKGQHQIISGAEKQREYQRQKQHQTSCTGFEHMLLPSSYNLNKSATKRVSIGVARTSCGVLTAEIYLEDVSKTGVKMDSETWTELYETFPTIKTFLESDDGETTAANFIIIRNIRIALKLTCFGRVVVFENIRDDENNGSGHQLANRTSGSPDDKKFKPSVTMKKVTFDNLEKVFECVAIRIRYATKLIGTISLCIDSICKEILKRCQNPLHDAQMIRQIMCIYQLPIKQEVWNSLAEQECTADEFNIIFHEIIALRFDIVLREILERRLPTNSL